MVTSTINTMTSHSNHSPGVVVSALADDGAAVKMVLQEDEQQPEHHDEGGGLEIGKLSPLYCLVSGSSRASKNSIRRFVIMEKAPYDNCVADPISC